MMSASPSKSSEEKLYPAPFFRVRSPELLIFKKAGLGPVSPGKSSEKKFGQAPFFGF
jgi:hypothetical protein